MSSKVNFYKFWNLFTLITFVVKFYRYIFIYVFFNRFCIKMDYFIIIMCDINLVCFFWHGFHKGFHDNAVFVFFDKAYNTFSHRSMEYSSAAIHLFRSISDSVWK